MKQLAFILFAIASIAPCSASILDAKAPPPPPAQPVLYVNFGDVIPDNTANWGNGSFLFHPGVTPAWGGDAAGKQQVLDNVREIVAEGGFDLAIEEFSGQKLVLGESEEIVVGGDLAWCANLFPVTSGIHFQGSFLSNTSGANSKSFSSAPHLFGITDYRMIACSIVLEGITGPGGWTENLNVAGYANNFVTGQSWTPLASEQLMQSVYGVAVPEPSLTDGGAFCLLVLAMKRGARRRR